MQAGKLDRRITLQRALISTDATGGEAKTWATLASVWASKEDVRDAERVRAQEVGSTITTRFQIRWSSMVRDLDERDRIVFDGRAYSIVAVKEIGRRVGLEITAAARSERA